MLGAFTDLLQTVLHLRLWIILHGDVREADDGVHGGADIVGHIVQEDGLGPVGVFRGMDGIRKLLIDLLVLGAVG